MNATLPTLREAGQGDPVVCLHASASTGGQWRALMERLAPRWRVIAPDLFGYCRHTPRDRVGRFVLDDELDWLAPVFERVGERVHLVGHSYGGLIAMLAALRWPQRVRSLALYEPACWSVAVRDDAAHPAAIELDGVGESVIRGVDAGQLEPTAADFVDYWSGRGVWAAMPPERRQAAMHVMPKIAREFVSERADHDTGSASLAAYARIGVPVLLMSGTASTAGARRVCELLRSAWPQCRFRELPGLGHMGPVVRPGPVCDEVERFLADPA